MAGLFTHSAPPAAWVAPIVPHSDVITRQSGGDSAIYSGEGMPKIEQPPGFWGMWRCSDFGKMGGLCDSSPERRYSEVENEEKGGGQVADPPYLEGMGGGRKETNPLRGTETTVEPKNMAGLLLVEKRRIPFGGLKLRLCPSPNW
jgi:hypothetical protein